LPLETSQPSSMQPSVTVDRRDWFRRLFSFVGPAYLVSVGYMDPGNWATDIEGGARFGYTLLWVLVTSNLMAILLQTLSARLGIVTGHDLAQACRREYPRPVVLALWFLAEIAIAACDLAEAIGTIIGLNLLFGMPLLWGCVLTGFDTLLFLLLSRYGVRKMEAFIVVLVATIGACFIVEVFLAKPDWGGVVGGLVPRLDSSALYVAIGIIGATVMPHNLYLHSSLVQSRTISPTYTGKSEACRFNLIDSVVALNAAFLVNAAILITAAADFFSRGIVVTEIQQAHTMLDSLLGGTLAPVAFAVALLAAGQSSTITGTIAGQIVMEGFLNLRITPWLRRLITRLVALGPAVIVISLAGSEGMYHLLVLSQVILSLQLPFAVIPLIYFTSDRHKMGSFANRPWVNVLAWTIAIVIIYLNMRLAMGQIIEWLSTGPVWIWPVLIVSVAGLAGLLIYLVARFFMPARAAWTEPRSQISESVAANLRAMRVSRVGAAIEHSAGDAAIISAALSMARAEKAELILIHVVNTPGAAVYGSESGSLHHSADAQYLDDLARELRDGDVLVDTELRFGNTVTELVRTVKEAGLGLLVMGSHGHAGLSDLIHGRTATVVQHRVDIPVLIVKSGAPESAIHPQLPDESTHK
jgi:manganese transport protein